MKRSVPPQNSVLAILAALAGASCAGGTLGLTPPDSCVTSLTMNNVNGPLLSANQIAVRGTLNLSATIVTSGICTNGATTMTWGTPNPGVVSVVKTGPTTATVTGLAPTGDVLVSVGVPRIAVSTFVSVVAGPPDHIAITPANPTVFLGNTKQLDVVFLDQDGFAAIGSAASVVWSVPTPGPVTISATGLVTATSLGSAVVTAAYAPLPAIAPATTLVTITAIPIASVTVSPLAASVAVLASATPFTATLKDASGAVVPTGSRVTWESQDLSIATVGAASGTVTGVAPGKAKIRAIVDGNAAIWAEAEITVTSNAPPPSPSLIAYAIADQPSAASYTPDLTTQYNGQGGAITVVRGAAGVYTVTIPGFGGGAGSSRIPFVNAMNASGVVCLPLAWNMNGPVDGVVTVNCSNVAGGLVDSKFTIFAAGQGALPGRFGFAASGTLPVGLAPVTLPAAAAWSSTLGSPQLVRDNINIVGRFLLTLRAAGPGIDIPVVQPAGATGARCQLSSWAAAEDIVCYPVGSAAFADAQFNGMMIDQGRTGKRFGALHSSLASLSRNSATGGNSVTQTGVGAYRLSFNGLGHSAGGMETVLVTAHALSFAAFCNPVQWFTTGSNLFVDVVCFNGAGAAVNTVDFVAVVIE